MLSVVLVDYFSSSLLMDCISGIYSETEAIDFEIIVVDNFF